MVDLKNMDGEPREVAQASINNAKEALKNYVAALSQCEHWVRNAAMTEIIAALGDAAPPEDVGQAWEESVENELLKFRFDDAVASAAGFDALSKKVATYEGYDG